MKIVLAAIAILLGLISVLPSVGEGTQFSNGDIHAEARKTHWLTISGNIRHNKSCRWYHNSKGRPCARMREELVRSVGGDAFVVLFCLDFCF
jgi:hypothetical protein